MTTKTRVDVAERLNEVFEELVNCYSQHANLVSQEIEIKTKTFESAFIVGGVVAAAEREAEKAAVNVTMAKIKKYGRIRQLEEERDHLRILIKYDLL